jgi:hypothetical protein
MTSIQITPEFKVGDGATYCIGSDRYAGTIIEVSPSGKTVLFQKERNPNGSVTTFTLRRDGTYKAVGMTYATLIPGKLDPHF